MYMFCSIVEPFRVKWSSGHAGTVSDLVHSLIIILLMPFEIHGMFDVQRAHTICTHFLEKLTQTDKQSVSSTNAIFLDLWDNVFAI